MDWRRTKEIPSKNIDSYHMHGLYEIFKIIFIVH